MRPWTILIVAALLPRAVAGQSAAMTGILIKATAVQIATETDTTWRQIKLRVVGDCLAFVYVTDPRGAPARLFADLNRVRFQKAGASLDDWEEVPPVEIGAMKGCG